MRALTGKWELLPLDHPTVVRRLVLQLNRHSYHGFYSDGERFNQARIHKGILQIRMGRGQWQGTQPGQAFSDPYGQTITASRTRCSH